MNSFLGCNDISKTKRIMFWIKTKERIQSYEVMARTSRPSFTSKESAREYISLAFLHIVFSAKTFCTLVFTAKTHCCANSAASLPMLPEARGTKRPLCPCTFLRTHLILLNEPHDWSFLQKMINMVDMAWEIRFWNQIKTVCKEYKKASAHSAQTS